MKSTKDLLHQIHDPNLSHDARAQLRCRLAKQLEEVGKYESAREAMGELWGNISDLPNLEISISERRQKCYSGLGR
jgi:hypothetical protein